MIFKEAGNTAIADLGPDVITTVAVHISPKGCMSGLTYTAISHNSMFGLSMYKGWIPNCVAHIVVVVIVVVALRAVMVEACRHSCMHV